MGSRGILHSEQSFIGESIALIKHQDAKLGH